MTIFKEVRQKYGLTQQEMADKLNISLRRYRSYEIGERMPKPEIIAKILYVRNKGNDRELAQILKELVNEGWYDEN